MTVALGLQLYLFPRPQFEQSCSEIIAGVAHLGFKHVEGLPAYRADYSADLKQHAVTMSGPHTVAAELQELESLIAYCQQMSAKHVISSGPIEWNERSAEDYQATAELLNKAGQSLKEHGIQLHYHNHEFECEAINGEQTAFDVLIDLTDSDAVNFCIDLGWIARAGQNPAAFLETYKERVSYVHLRDFSGDKSVALGQGDIDLKSIVAAIDACPQIAHVMVEQRPARGWGARRCSEQHPVFASNQT